MNKAGLLRNNGKLFHHNLLALLEIDTLYLGLTREFPTIETEPFSILHSPFSILN